MAAVGAAGLAEKVPIIEENMEDGASISVVLAGSFAGRSSRSRSSRLRRDRGRSGAAKARRFWISALKERTWLAGAAQQPKDGFR